MIPFIFPHQALVRVKVVGGGAVVTASLQNPMEYQVKDGCPALIVGHLDNPNRITDAVCASPPADVEVETPFNEDLFTRAVQAYSRFPQMFKSSPP